MNRTKKEAEGQSRFLLDLRHPSSPARGHRCACFLGFQTQVLTLSLLLPPHSQTLGLRLNYTTGFLGSQAYRQQIMGLLGFVISLITLKKCNLLIPPYLKYHFNMSLTKINEIFYIPFSYESLKSNVYFTLTEHLTSDRPHFKRSTATCG